MRPSPVRPPCAHGLPARLLVLTGRLLMFAGRLCPLLVQLLLEVSKHLDDPRGEAEPHVR